MKNLFKLSLLAFVFISNTTFGVCPEWSSRKLGTLDTNNIDEASGLVASSLHKGKYIWVNDSGGSSSMFATSADGKMLRTVKLSHFKNVDFEAMALGPCPANVADSCIYLGDIGNNMSLRRTVKIGVFKESDFWASQTLAPEKVIEFSYAGEARNAEAMVVTPEGQILIFTKIEGSTEIYALSMEGKASKVAKVDLKGILKDSKGKGVLVTDASLSPDGQKVLILSYGDILEVNLKSFSGLSSRNWVNGVDFNVVKGPNLSQQETITYSSEKSFLVSSESEDGEIPGIYSYDCK